MRTLDRLCRARFSPRTSRPRDTTPPVRDMAQQTMNLLTSRLRSGSQRGASGEF